MAVTDVLQITDIMASWVILLYIYDSLNLWCAGRRGQGFWHADYDLEGSEVKNAARGLKLTSICTPTWTLWKLSYPLTFQQSHSAVWHSGPLQRWQEQ